MKRELVWALTLQYAQAGVQTFNAGEGSKGRVHSQGQAERYWQPDNKPRTL